MKATTDLVVVGCWPGGKEVVCILDKEVVCCFSIDLVTRRLYVSWTRRYRSTEVSILSRSRSRSRLAKIVEVEVEAEVEVEICF